MVLGLPPDRFIVCAMVLGLPPDRFIVCAMILRLPPDRFIVCAMILRLPPDYFICDGPAWLVWMFHKCSLVLVINKLCNFRS